MTTKAFSSTTDTLYVSRLPNVTMLSRSGTYEFVVNDVCDLSLQSEREREITREGTVVFWLVRFAQAGRIPMYPL